MVEDWKDVFCLGSGARQGSLLLPLLFNTVLKVLVKVARQEKERKAYRLERKK